MIGKVLGHKSPTATQIYSKFAHDPIRAAMEKAHADMLTAASSSAAHQGSTAKSIVGQK